MAESLRRVNRITHEETDKALSMWVCQALEDGITVTGDVIREKWRHFAQMLQIPEDQWPTLSKGWLTKFKERTGLKERKKHGEAGSQSVSTADAKHK